MDLNKGGSMKLLPPILGIVFFLSLSSIVKISAMEDFVLSESIPEEQYNIIADAYIKNDELNKKTSEGDWKQILKKYIDDRHDKIYAIDSTTKSSRYISTQCYIQYFAQDFLTKRSFLFLIILNLIEAQILPLCVRVELPRT